MDLELFRALEVVLRAYSRQAPKNLIDHYLRLRIIVRILPPTFAQLAQHIRLSPTQQTLFASKSKHIRNKRIACLVIDHPLALPLSSQCLRQIEDCIAINEGGTCSNLLGINAGQEQLSTRALLLRVNQSDFKQLVEQLDAYLSVCQVFLGHLHLTVSCFEAPAFPELLKELEPSQDDQFADYRELGYFRCLEERASRISLEELSDSCRVERRDWGQMLVFQGGQECLIVWLTCRRLPYLGQIPEVHIPKSGRKGMPVMVESQLGLKIFKRKELMKVSLQELSATTIIFNVKSKEKGWRKDVQQLFDREATQLLSRGCLERNTVLLQQSMELCQRISEILDVPAIHLLKKLINN